MAHFAELDADNVVLRVIVAEPEFINSGAVGDPARWVRTSYTGSMRKNFAGVGYTYDAGRDAFIPPRPYPSWSLDEATCQWVPPVPYPNDARRHVWDQDAQTWQLGGGVT